MMQMWSPFFSSSFVGSAEGTEATAVVMRLLPDGSPDPGFGAGGVVRSYLGAPTAAAVGTTPTKTPRVTLTGVAVDDQDRIVLGGLHADLLAAEEERLRAGLRSHSFLQQAAQIDLLPARLASSTLAGAAELALQPLLDDPRLLS